MLALGGKLDMRVGVYVLGTVVQKMNSQESVLEMDSFAESLWETVTHSL